jgi:hypothetical protein
MGSNKSKFENDAILLVKNQFITKCLPNDFILVKYDFANTMKKS